MKRPFFFISIFFWTSCAAHAQVAKSMEGTVSYVNATNVYVKFENTKDLMVNDTLMLSIKGKSTKALIVKIISSKSCITTSIVPDKISVGNSVSFYVKSKIELETPITAITNKADSLFMASNTPLAVVEKPKIKIQTYNGRLSLSTNGSMSQAEKDYNRIRTSFNFDVNNIKGGKFSVSSYVNFRRRFGVNRKVGDTQVSSFKEDFKIYTLSITYDATDNTSITLGRKINNRTANMGAIDGLQFEHKFKKVITGGFIGTRPDQMDYSFNKSLFQFGAFVAHESEKKSGSIQTSLAIAEQKYHGNTDRRFAYFQHSNSLVKNLNLFYSLELDLFQNIDSVKSNKINLTSTYFSVRYKPFKNMSLTTSYDNRKNVIYYETYRTYIDQLLNQEIRQGVRLQMNYNISKMLSLNLSGFYRYQQSRPDPTKNYVANLFFNQIPGLKGSLNLNYNAMKTYYMNGNIYGARLNKDFFNSKLSTELNYRKVDYKFNSTQAPLLQDVIGLSTSIYLSRNTSVMLSNEVTIEPHINYSRYYITLSQRFRNKK